MSRECDPRFTNSVIHYGGGHIAGRLQSRTFIVHKLCSAGCNSKAAATRRLDHALDLINTRPTTSKFIQGPKITMDERDGDIFVDQAARCRRLAWSIADDAAKPELTGGGIRDDGGLAEERQEN